MGTVPRCRELMTQRASARIALRRKLRCHGVARGTAPAREARSDLASFFGLDRAGSVETADPPVAEDATSFEAGPLPSSRGYPGAALPYLNPTPPPPQPPPPPAPQPHPMSSTLPQLKPPQISGAHPSPRAFPPRCPLSSSLSRGYSIHLGHQF